MLLQIILVWHTQNLISVMINYMLVMVSELSYLIQPIIFYVLLNEFLRCLMSCMFKKLKKDSYLFNNSTMKTVSSLNFTLLFSMLRISSPRRFCFPVRVRMAFMSFQKILPRLCPKLSYLLVYPPLLIFGIVDLVTQAPGFWVS
jgi:hypothetical protein